jgi:restriction system protein
MGFWMVRAGEGGYLVNDFERAGCVAVGWRSMGSFAPYGSLDDMKRGIAAAYPEMPGPAQANSASMAFKFARLMRVGDAVVTYDPSRREYLLGTVAGDYAYSPGVVPDYNHVRNVEWERRIGRDTLTASSRNTLGSTLTLFEPGDEVLRDLRNSRDLPSADALASPAEAVQEYQTLRQDVIGRSHEFIKDRLLSLSPDDMESLVAALLRAMGYKARVTPKGKDRGKDVIASPDGFGFQQPRIFAEVKHRPRESMGAPALRGFAGGLRASDRGLYVSTGGFTQEAMYEAERSTIPITLVDLDELATHVVDHYEKFDSDGRSLIPLVRVYWPAS